MEKIMKSQQDKKNLKKDKIKSQQDKINFQQFENKSSYLKKVKKFNDILRSKNIGTDLQLKGQDVYFLNNIPHSKDIIHVSKVDQIALDEYSKKMVSKEELSKECLAFQMRILLNSKIMDLPQVKNKKNKDFDNKYIDQFLELNSSKVANENDSHNDTVNNYDSENNSGDDRVNNNLNSDNDDNDTNASIKPTTISSKKTSFKSKNGTNISRKKVGKSKEEADEEDIDNLTIIFNSKPNLLENSSDQQPLHHLLHDSENDDIDEDNGMPLEKKYGIISAFKSYKKFISAKKRLADAYKSLGEKIDIPNTIQICDEPCCLESAVPGFSYCIRHIGFDKRLASQTIVARCEAMINGHRCCCPTFEGKKYCKGHSYLNSVS